MPYCLYLRKSRTDLDAEANGETETLARHEKILLDLAKRMHLDVTEIYREVVSGETISSRPVVQRVLNEVENGLWDGVLVVEIERLARGDTIDQGIVSRAFKFSNTKIITPLKTYDPNNEFDEEYFEFGLFMSRREYKTIRRRLTQGRMSSAKEGKHTGSKAPYGYDRIHVDNGKGYTLLPNVKEAPVVKMMFDWFVHGEVQEDGSRKKLGTMAIANRLTDLRIPTPSGNSVWSQRSVHWILHNPVYIGKIRWGYKKDKKIIVDGIVKRKRIIPPEKDQILVEGLHPAIIPEDIFEQAQDIFGEGGAPSVTASRELKNPLSGIVVCGICGAPLRYKIGYNRQSNLLHCRTHGCECKGSYFNIVEKRLLDALQEWIDHYKMSWNDMPEETNSLLTLKKQAYDTSIRELNTLTKQLDKAHDFLEQGIYDTDTFLSRSKALSEKIADTEKVIAKLSADIQNERRRENNRRNLIPKAEKLIDVYWQLPTATAKNEMLKEILEKVEYTKLRAGDRSGKGKDDFELILYPKLPKS